MKESDKAYLAGLIDGEGHIILAFQKKERRLLRPMIGISNRNLKVLKWVSQTFLKGFLYKDMKQRQPTAQPVYYLSFASRVNCSKIIKIALPYLKIKKKQAKLVLEFCQNHKNAHYTKRDWNIYKTLRKLNTRGKTCFV